MLETAGAAFAANGSMDMKLVGQITAASVALESQSTSFKTFVVVLCAMVSETSAHQSLAQDCCLLAALVFALLLSVSSPGCHCWSSEFDSELIAYFMLIFLAFPDESIQPPPSYLITPVHQGGQSKDQFGRVWLG
jgi:hypothetical protein